MRLVVSGAFPVGAFAIVAAMSFAQGPQARIMRLSPAAVRELPVNLVKDLQRRGCTIPQAGYNKKPNNVIKGEFAKPGQRDWAVLCSIKEVSTILVFWNGSEKNPSAIAPMKDQIYIQASGKSQLLYQGKSVR